MNYKEIMQLDDSKWFEVLKPLKRLNAIKEKPIIIGFDTEYVHKGGKHITLSIQFYNDKKSLLMPISYSTSEIDLILRQVYSRVSDKPMFPISIDEDALFAYLLSFLLFDSEYKKLPDNEIYLIAHFSQAELSNFESLDSFEIFPASRGLFSSIKFDNPAGKSITVNIIDLYGIFSTSLDEIGDYIGVPKISLNNLGGMTDDYWKENMDELLKKYPDIFSKYAIRDSMICYKAYTKVRDFFIDKYEIDILNYTTLASIAGAIFRKKYLSEAITPTKFVHYPRRKAYKLVDTTIAYSKTFTKKEVFAGDLNVRRSALESYHGARVESCYRGRLDGVNLAYYDVDSLYPSSALLMPLPLEETRWFRLLDVQDRSKKGFNVLLNRGEGFVELEFSFPDTTAYPNLPVLDSREGILYFPLDGVSQCTLSELRMAIKLGLTDYKIIDGYAFLPTRREINHPLREYMEHMHELKNSSERGSIDYQLFKLLMNILVGKLVQKNTDRLAQDLVKEGLLSRTAYNKFTRKLSRVKSVGSLWSPEWASLILGKSRSIISEFVAKGSYIVSTDSVLLPKDVDINCQSLEELKSVGSNLKHEFDVTHGVIIRSRLYALNPLEDNPDRIHIARHSVSCKPQEFLDIIRQGYTTKEIPDLAYKSRKLTKYDESIRTGIPLNTPLNTPQEKDLIIKLDWDGKRRLLSPVENPFSSGSFSTPLTYEELNKNIFRKSSRRKPKFSKKPGRPTRVAKEEVITLFSEGTSQSEIAKKFEVSRQYINKVIKQEESINNG